jgi:hypothetical protein
VDGEREVADHGSGRDHHPLAVAPEGVPHRGDHAPAGAEHVVDALIEGGAQARVLDPVAAGDAEPVDALPELREDAVQEVRFGHGATSTSYGLQYPVCLSTCPEQQSDASPHAFCPAFQQQRFVVGLHAVRAYTGSPEP